MGLLIGWNGVLIVLAELPLTAPRCASIRGA